MSPKSITKPTFMPFSFKNRQKQQNELVQLFTVNPIVIPQKIQKNPKKYKRSHKKQKDVKKAQKLTFTTFQLQKQTKTVK